MDLTFQVPMQYCSLQHQILLLSPVPSTTGYCFCFGSIPSFFLDLFLHWPPVAQWTPTDLGSTSFSILSFCLSYCSWRSQGKNTEVVCHSLLQWTTFCQTSPPWPVCLGWPHTAWLSFIELDKAVVHVIRLASFCDYGFSVSALWCPLSTPTILLGFLLPWTCGISSRLLQQSTAAAPYLGQGHPFWPWTWNSSSQPSCAHAVASPWTWGCSWVFTGRTDAEAETPILWPPHVKSWLIGKDPDAGRDWGQEEKRKTEDEMAGWHHQVDGHEFV